MMKEYGILVLPDHIVNWLTGYFAERGHITKFQGIMSTIAFINASVVQSSGIGPSSYIVVASDLQPINRENKIAKYADDSYLLIVSNHLGTAKSEFQHIQSWASRNNLCLNASKTKELIVYKRGGGKCRAPLEVIPGAARVTQMKVLGVTLSADLSMTLHLDETLVRCLDGGSEDPSLPWPAPWTAGGSDPCNNYGHSAICGPSLVGVCLRG